MKRVVIGMSGGVDSSVAAYLLKQQGYDVVGLFMKNWDCESAEPDFNDVKRVCEKIGIPYYAVNFQKQYMESVFDEFLNGLKMGWTPNPDILCNKEIKFGVFLQYAAKLNADYVATGHYCKIENGTLCRADDETKDQSYFLCALTKQQLEKVIFPLSHIKKTEVRKIAAQLGFINSAKKDSTGICFIGEQKIKNFLKTYLGTKIGQIRTLDDKIVGSHDGLMYYTIGQRKGLNIGGINSNTKRWFVVKKDLSNNVLYVNNGDCKELYSNKILLQNFNSFFNFIQISCTAKVRYRQTDQICIAKNIENKEVEVTFLEKQRAVTLGQWCVLYNKEKCLGGGIISAILS
jgi:tRNA-specific 2-thiouridylase